MVLAKLTRATIARKSFAQFGYERLSALLDASAAGPEREALLEVFQQLLEPWGGQRIGRRARHPSYIADDGAPFEFCAAFSRSAAEVQVYVEPRDEAASLRGSQERARALLDTLAERHRLSLERLRRVEDLFFPASPEGPFALWIGVSCAPGRELAFKAYLNPQVRGVAHTLEVVEEAAGRLGFGRQWRLVRETLAHGSLRHDDIGILSLDLSSVAQARMKLYIRHHHSMLRDVKAVASLARDYSAEDCARFYATLAESEGPFIARPPQTELAFVDPESDRPHSVTHELPIESHVDDDEQARRRIERCLSSFDIPTAGYARAVDAFATRPLAARKGIHAHVTLRRVGSEPRLAVYFASETYIHQPSSAGLAPDPGPTSSTRSHGGGIRA